MADLKTASEAYNASCTGDGDLRLRNSPFVCPFPECRAYADHYWGALVDVRVRIGGSTYSGRQLEEPAIYVALCGSCHQEAVFLDGTLVYPPSSDAPPPAADMPDEIRQEYDEAAAILPGSPRGSAALLRLAVQKLLPILGATKRDINDQIAELVAEGIVPPRIQAALDTLRVVGNEAVHPGTIDLNDDNGVAMGLFRLLNFIIEKAISDPKHADEMFALLPQGKRDAIARRDQQDGG